MRHHIEGPLYYERMGRSGPPMLFVHPNPMDQSAWMYQLAHFSTWFRCVAVDIPGYGRSPHSTDGLTLPDLAEACWDALDESVGDEPAVLVGCSAGSHIVPQMYHLRPKRTRAVVISSSGGSRPRADWLAILAGRTAEYEKAGVGFRWDYTFQDFSPKFRETAFARYCAELFTERNDTADVPSIVRQFKALGDERPTDFYTGIRAPSVVITGSEDRSHDWNVKLAKMIPGCELAVIEGAGHACQLEQPWAYDRAIIALLRKHALLPETLVA